MKNLELEVYSEIRHAREWSWRETHVLHHCLAVICDLLLRAYSDLMQSQLNRARTQK